MDEDYPVGMHNYDSKIEAKRRMQQLKAFNLTCVGLSAFMSNIEAHWSPTNHYKVCALGAGNAAMPWISPEDIGNAAAQCFALGSAAYGKEYYLVGAGRPVLPATIPRHHPPVPS